MSVCEDHISSDLSETESSFKCPAYSNEIFAELYISELRRDLFNYFSNKDIKNEYLEVCEGISLTFRIGDRIKRYHFSKEEPCHACVGKSCGCSCLREGRLRHLEITDCNGTKGFFKNIKNKTESIMLEETGDDKNGSIIFSDGKSYLKVSTKLIWVWCNKQLKLGEFEEGARRQRARMQSSLTTFDSPIAELIGA